MITISSRNKVQQPKISIITPSFNQGQFIEETILSVLNQNYSNLEFIVVDGKSTDDTLSILKKYTGKIKWLSEKDNGQSDAINKGFKMATGDIIAWLNTDDYYLPGTLKKVANFFSQNKDCYWLTGDYLIVDKNGKTIQPFVRWYKKLIRKFGGYNTLTVLNFIAQPATFLKKEVLSSVGNLNAELNYTMDYEWWLKIYQKYALSKLNQPLAAFRIHGLSKGGSQYKKQFQEELKVVKRFPHSKLAYFLHKIHNKFIVMIYNLIK